MHLRWVVSLLIAGVGAITGCQVDATTTVTVAEDGSGTVEVEVVLDAEALDRVPDLDSQLRVDDLEASGWEITGPEPTAEGGRRVVATKPFADPEQARAVLTEVTGPDGVLGDARVERDRGFGRADQAFAATLDLSEGIGAFGDDELTTLLGGLPVGQDVATLEEDLGASLDELTSFTVVADLPAGDVSSAGTPEIDETDGRRVFRWEGSLGDPARDLRAETGETDRAVIALAIVAGVAGLALVIVTLVLLVARWRRRA